MVLGGIWVPSDKVRQINIDIRHIKERHRLSHNLEIKWTKISPAQIQFYEDLVHYFFINEDLHFRSLVVTDKFKLRHGDFKQDHDSWYYKMYFVMLKAILNPEHLYKIYIDIKDTRSEEKVACLHEALCNNMYDFKHDIIQRVQQIRSHEVEIMQLADLLIGAVSYANRGLTKSSAKSTIVTKIREYSGYDLTRSTLLLENKLNVFIWHPQEAE